MKFSVLSRLAIILAWLVSMLAVLRYEAYPEWFTQTIPGYRGLISDTLLARESWSRLLINGVPAGYSHTTLGVNDDTDDNLLEINNRLHLRFLAGEQSYRVVSHTDIALNRQLHLVAFTTSISAAGLHVSAAGQQRDDGFFEVKLSAGDIQSVRIIEIPDDTLLYSPGQELALRHLRPGKRLTLKTLNPLTLQSTALTVEAVANEEIMVGGDVIDTTRLVTAWQGMRLESWVDDDGRVVRQETPLGWSIEACSPEAALAAVDPAATPPTLFGERGGAGIFRLLFGKAMGAR